MTHWTDKYTGLPYELGRFDCMDLIVLVQKEVFGKTIVLPIHSKSGLERAHQISEHKEEFAKRVEVPEEGDTVLLKVKGYVQHAGIVCYVRSEKYVLHNIKAFGTVCQRESDMLAALRGYAVEGYYRWI